MEVMIKETITRAISRKRAAFLRYGKKLISLKKTEGILPCRKENGSTLIAKKVTLYSLIHLDNFSHSSIV